MTVVLNPEYSDARRQRDMLWNMLSSSLNMPFHERLKRERKLRGLSQKEVSEALGIEIKTFNRWESGRLLPQPLYRRRLSEFLGKSLIELGLIENDSSQSQEDILKPQESNEVAQYSRGNQQLRQAREEREWTREELAEQIGTTSITIERWERRVTFPNRYMRQKLCQLFNKTEGELGLLYSSNEGIVPLSILGKGNEEEEQRHCEYIIGQLTARQKQVLQAFAGGLLPSEVAELLSISAPTVSTHTTVLLSSCRDAWSIEAKERLDYRFLQLKFEKYFEEHDRSENN